TDALEIKDISEPAPVRRATKVVFSPLVLGGGWVFGTRGGSETVLLLARRNALPPDIKLGNLLKELPSSPKLERSDEPITVRVTGRRTPARAATSVALA